MERNEGQSSDYVQYGLIGPGFITEARYLEAIRLLWSWPEGSELLMDAGEHGVSVNTASGDHLADAFGSYSAFLTQVMVHPDYVRSPTWLMAAVLAHELQHAADGRAQLHTGRFFEDCIAREQRAFETERRFVHWLTERFGELPTLGQASARYSHDELGLFLNVTAVARSADITPLVMLEYEARCAPVKR